MAFPNEERFRAELNSEEEISIEEKMSKTLLELLPRLVSTGRCKAERLLEQARNGASIDLQSRELVSVSHESTPEVMFPGNTNSLIYGDNLLTMLALLTGNHDRPSLEGKIDLIYIDPPFDSKATYRTKVKLANKDLSQGPTILEQFAYSDTWADGTFSYLQMIIPRLILMKKLLADTGCFFIHLDHHVSHYVKIILDDLYGKENFQNEIIWHKGREGGGANRLPTEYNSILVYRKTNKIFWNSPKKPYKLSTIKKIEKDEKGWFYTRGRMGRKPAAWEIEAGKGTKTYVWLDPKVDKEKVIKILTSENCHEKGALLGDVWNSEVIGQGARQTNYATEKPEKLIELILSAASPSNGLIADFFCGSGTTAAVAEKLGRRWIACDFGKPACMITRKRLMDMGSKPFLYMNIGDYQVESLRINGYKSKQGDLAEVVIRLYGALPLKEDKHLGYKAQTLVYCDRPTKITGLRTIKKAVQLRNELHGGYKKVVVLGWNFEPGLTRQIEELNDPNLEVLAIPNDLLDRMKKQGKLKDGDIRFSSLQYLELGPIERKIIKNTELLKIKLSNYVLLSPESINVDKERIGDLKAIINKDPRALIAYWGIDPNFDGKIFRPLWHNYRDEDKLFINSEAVLEGLPKKSGKRTICVKSVDVFGFEAEVVREV